MFENKAKEEKRQMVSDQVLSITNQFFPFGIKCRIKKVFLKDVESIVVLLIRDMPCLCKQCRQNQLASSAAN